jgi:hypothetical protein
VLVLLNPVLGQGIAHAYRPQHGGMVNAGRSTPGPVAGGPDDMAFCVGQFPGCAQVVRLYMQGLVLQRLGGCFLRHHALQARLQFALQRQDLGVFQTLSSLRASCKACCTKGLPRALSRACWSLLQRLCTWASGTNLQIYRDLKI